MELFPPMPLADWRDTKQTLHRFCQVVGKLRLAASSRRNHWWNVPFHLTGRGTTTRPMGQADGNPIFTIDFDFVDHQLRIHTLDGRTESFPLGGQSVASFHCNLFEALDRLGIKASIAIPRPFDLPDADDPSPTTPSTPAMTRPGPAATGRSSARSTWSWRSSPPASQARSARSTTSGTPSTSPTPASRTATSTSRPPPTP
jgi:hypothetical protein